MSDDVAIANRALNERGYIVVVHFPGLHPPPVPGQRYDYPVDSGGEQLPAPFFCIGTATEAEYIEQHQLYLGGPPVRQEWMGQPSGYFKLTAE